MLVFLVGFMGCGKSYIGRNLAPLLDYEYIDMDKHIEEQEGMSINQIFDIKGETYFRNLEHTFLLNLKETDNKLIATGGGVPCFYNNMEIMNTKGLTLYLNRDKDIVLARLKKGIHKRPLLQGLDTQELSNFYDKKLNERKAFYEQATIKVHNADYIQIKEMIDSYLSLKII